MKYQRVLLKLSGESLAGGGACIHRDRLNMVAEEVAATQRQKIELGIVIGAGNIWRGADKGMDRVTADSMGMLATVINALAVSDVLKSHGIPAVVQSAIEVGNLAERYAPARALSYLAGGNVVLLAGGTGNPYFTTDTTAALRASEIKAAAILKATQVDGVYSEDPRKNPAAKRYATLTFDQAIDQQLKIMDTAAFSLARENRIPIIVFDFYKKGNLLKVLSGEPIGTMVTA